MTELITDGGTEQQQTCRLTELWAGCGSPPGSVRTHQAASWRHSVNENAARLASTIDGWAALANDLADRYEIHLDRRDPNREVRFVAVARTLNVRPYAIITSDANELRQAVAQGDAGPQAPETPGRAKR